MKRLLLLLILIPLFSSAQLTGDLTTDVIYSWQDSSDYRAEYLEFRMDMYRKKQVNAIWWGLGSIGAFIFASTINTNENELAAYTLYGMGGAMGVMSLVNYFSSFRWINKNKGVLRKEYYFTDPESAWRKSEYDNWQDEEKGKVELYNN